jgi:hypothetical protein
VNIKVVNALKAKLGTAKEALQAAQEQKETIDSKLKEVAKAFEEKVKELTPSEKTNEENLIAEETTAVADDEITTTDDETTTNDNSAEDEVPAAVADDATEGTAPAEPTAVADDAAEETAPATPAAVADDAAEETAPAEPTAVADDAAEETAPAAPVAVADDTAADAAIADDAAPAADAAAILGGAPAAPVAVADGGAVVDDSAVVDDGAGVAADETTTDAITEEIGAEEAALAGSIPEDEKKIYDIVNDPTALAELIEEPGVHIGWYWWILIIAALGATGWALYRKYKKNKDAEANGGKSTK